MVSTRQMSNVGGQGSSSDDAGPSSRPTRHSSVITTNFNKIVYPIPVATVVENPESALVLRVPTNKNVTFLSIPPEVMEKIFVHVGYKKVAQMRIICRQMNHVCGLILNSTFHKQQTQMLQRFQNIKARMPRRESARRSHPLACESDIVETLHMRLTLLQMTFGKHIERKHCCFFPGEILDEVNRVVRYINLTPKLARPYKVTDELFDLSTMAMEYFKEKIEPKLPEIAYFGTDFIGFSASSTSKNYLCLESSSTTRDIMDKLDSVSPPMSPDDRILESPPPPQSNMVLRKRIRKIKQGMKRYNNQLSVLRNELRTSKRKSCEQQKQISEQQKQLAELQKQTLDYVARLDENDKKNDETSRKFQTLLQELNKCKTELQYWRSKSPATPSVCNGCGNVVAPLPQEDLQALINQGVTPEDVDVVLPTVAPSEFIPISDIQEESLDAELCDQTRGEDMMGSFLDIFKTQEATTSTDDLKELKVVSPKLSAGAKRKLDEPTTPSTAQYESDSPSKKPRRVLKRCGKLRSK